MELKLRKMSIRVTKGAGIRMRKRGMLMAIVAAVKVSQNLL